MVEPQFHIYKLCDMDTGQDPVTNQYTMASAFTMGHQHLDPPGAQQWIFGTYGMGSDKWEVAQMGDVTYNLLFGLSNPPNPGEFIKLQTMTSAQLPTGIITWQNVAYGYPAYPGCDNDPITQNPDCYSRCYQYLGKYSCGDTMIDGTINECFGYAPTGPFPPTAIINDPILYVHSVPNTQANQHIATCSECAGFGPPPPPPPVVPCPDADAQTPPVSTTFVGSWTLPGTYYLGDVVEYPTNSGVYYWHNSYPGGFTYSDLSGGGMQTYNPLLLTQWQPCVPVVPPPPPLSVPCTSAQQQYPNQTFSFSGAWDSVAYANDIWYYSAFSIVEFPPASGIYWWTDSGSSQGQPDILTNNKWYLCEPGGGPGPPPIAGCTDSTALNYDPAADGCLDPQGIVVPGDFSCCLYPQPKEKHCLPYLVKEEFLMNVAQAPETRSNVFIERGKASVFQRAQRLSEIKSIGDLETHGYGYYKIQNET